MGLFNCSCGFETDQLGISHCRIHHKQHYLSEECPYCASERHLKEMDEYWKSPEGKKSSEEILKLLKEIKK